MNAAFLFTTCIDRSRGRRVSILDLFISNEGRLEAVGDFGSRHFDTLLLNLWSL